MQDADTIELVGHLLQGSVFLDHPRDAIAPGEVLTVAELVREAHVPRVFMATVRLQDRIVTQSESGTGGFGKNVRPWSQ